MRSRTLCLRSATAIGLALFPFLAQAVEPKVAPAETLALVAARWIDGKSGRVATPGVVVVAGERIVAVGGREVIPPGARVIELGDSTLLPGLIDAHSHPLIAGDDYQLDHLRASSAMKALRGLKAVQDNLQAGWTTLRIAGDADVFYAHLDLRRALEEGLFVGPRLSGAGHYISTTGGGGDINFLGPEHRVVADGLVVDGVDAMRKAVREEIKYGSDWIKLLVTGAFMSAGDNPKDVHFSPEELAAAVEEARRHNVPVMAHAHAAEGIKAAIRAGVRSIEHGTFIDAEGVALAKEKGVFLVPTLYIGDHYIEHGDPNGPQAKMIELSKRYKDENYRAIGAAIRAGVKIAVGSDFGGYDQGINVRELGSLVKAGMTPIEAIEAATRVGAELLGWDDRVGTLEKGKLADIIAVPGNPVEDLAVLERVSFVMVGGKIVKGRELAPR